MGFSALKFDLDQPLDNDPDPYKGRVSNAAVERKREIVAAAREAVGDGIDLALDVHWDYSLDSAKRLCRALEPYDLMWLEDLLARDGPQIQDGYIEVPEAPGLGVELEDDVVREHLLDPGTMFA